MSADPIGAELAAALRAVGCSCELPPSELARGSHERTCPLWQEPPPRAPDGARQWLGELLSWAARVGPFNGGLHRAEAGMGVLCSHTALGANESLALFREFLSCELHGAFQAGCVHCRANVERRGRERSDREAERTGIKHCESCRAQLARVAGPGLERGWHCFSCDPPFDDLDE